ncbi:MAG: hypothetical protein WBP12_05610 [Candidatus Saccharimonas sp.]
MSKPATPRDSSTKRRRIIFWPRRLQRPILETIVVDTSSLVDFSLPVIETHASTTAKSVLDAARRALIASTTYREHILKEALTPLVEQPAATYSRYGIVGSSWHHGAHYNNYWLGPVEQIIQRSNLTENERERITTVARQLGTKGSTVYAVATSVETQQKNTDPATFQPLNLNYIGLLSHRLRPHPDLTRSLALCKRQGIDIVYATCDDELLVSTVAHMTKLIPKTALPQRYHPSLPIPPGNACYAGLSTDAHSQLLASFDPRTTLATIEPLPVIVKTIQVR